MDVETRIAAHWWAKHLKLPKGVDSSDEKKEAVADERSRIFAFSLEKELQKRYYGHWYVDNPLRGSGYRCVLYDVRMDTVLEAAAREANIPISIMREKLPRWTAMWVNPGEVKVKTEKNSSTLYKKGGPLSMGNNDLTGMGNMSAAVGINGMSTYAFQDPGSGSVVGRAVALDWTSNF